MTPNLEYLTKCRVPGCTKEFVSSPLDIPIIGKPNERVVKFVTALMDHLGKKHPEVMMRVSNAIQEYMGFLVVSMFELNDPRLIEMRERIRAEIAVLSRRNNIPDSMIDGKIAELGFDDTDAEGLRILLRDMRDLLTEQGNYAPRNGTPTEKPLVTI